MSNDRRSPVISSLSQIGRLAACCVFGLLVACADGVAAEASVGKPAGGGSSEVLLVQTSSADQESQQTTTGPLEQLALNAPRVREEVRSGSPGKLQSAVDSVVAKWLKKAVAQAPKRLRADSVKIALIATELKSGRVLAERSAAQSMMPASNLKLLTTAAALVAWGTEADLVTTFASAAPIEQGVLQGDLIVYGAGDPLWAADGRGGERLAQPLQQLRELGVRRIAGDIVLYTSRFDPPAAGPGWPNAKQHWDDYCALAGAFTVNGGVLLSEIVPGRDGERAQVSVQPWPTGIDTKLDVRTRRGAKVAVNVGATMRRVVVKGELPPSKRPYLADFRHPAPIHLFGAVLSDQLERAGIALDGSLTQSSGSNVLGAHERTLAELRSPVIDLLTPINTESVNGVADQLFFALGHHLLGDGSRAGGTQAVGAVFAALGLDTTGWKQVDGSGLSRDNRVTVDQLNTLLRAVLLGDADRAEAYRRSLAIAGETGTLEDRMKAEVTRGKVFGKTGWIGGVSALSGVAQTEAGGEVSFSILVEYPRAISGLNRSVFKPLQDELVTLFCEQAP